MKKREIIEWDFLELFSSAVVHVFDTAKKHKMALTLSEEHAYKLLGAPSNIATTDDLMI